MRLLILSVVVAMAVAQPHQADRCTVMLVGAKASATRVPITTHTADCTNCDFRLAKVPQQQHAPGSMRNIPLLSQVYPRYVGKDRGAPEYYQENLQQGFFNWSNTPIIGQIPQVETTFGYVDAIYPVVNEYQLATRESTCGARFYAKPATQGGTALFDITELARVAFERTKTARDAINLMADLAVKHGYYGAYWGDKEDEMLNQAGETLTVTDPKKGWVFHILPDDTGASAIWVAQRIPDNHITAIGNQFIIHDVNLTASDNFLGSANLYDIAKRHNFWDGKSRFDFTAVYAKPFSDGTFATRRQWHPLGKDYPFSVEVATPLDVSDIMRFQRDHYENTPFDLTQGRAAGPYSSPDRYLVGNVPLSSATGDRIVGFERPISYHTTSYSYVTQLHPSNRNNALVWFGPYVPHATSYMPIYAKVSSVPSIVSGGSLRKFDLNSSFWINALVGNYAGHFYKHVMPAVSTVQLAVEKKAADAQAGVQAKAQSILASQGEAAMVIYLTSSTNSFAMAAHDAFVALFYDMVTRFHDGTIFGNFSNEAMDVKAMGYPTWWLEEVGYFGPKTQGLSVTTFIVVVLIVAVVTTALGFWLGRRDVQSRGYAFIK
ncbi:unnamed protein product [Aphanomyces euteiches]